MMRILTSCAVLLLLFTPGCGGGESTPTKSGPGDQAPKPQNPSRNNDQGGGKPERPVRIDMVMAKAYFIVFFISLMSITS